MCQISALAGIKKGNLAKVEKLVKALAIEMSKSEKDGLGYAAITKDGQIYGEKWLNNDDAFKVTENPEIDPLIEKMEEVFGAGAKFKTEPIKEDIYTAFGDHGLKNHTVAVILHSRKATQGEKSLDNVHPFVIQNDASEPETALIHNGTINNHEQLTKTMSTCDSETILHEYMKESLYYNPWGIETVAKRLRGEYAVAVLSSIDVSKTETKPILDIFKSNKDLYVGYVPEIETLVFCTSEWTLERAVKEAEMTVKYIMKLEDGFYWRFDATTGERCEDMIKFELSNKWGQYYDNAKTPTVLPPKKEKVEDLKKQFEYRHPAVFSKQYINPQVELTDEEDAIYKELEMNGKTNHRALYLVNAVLKQA